MSKRPDPHSASVTKIINDDNDDDDDDKDFDDLCGKMICNYG